MDLPDDLASAVRKSWSESAQPLSVLQGTDSPISTPRGTPKSSGRGSIPTSMDEPTVDYQLLKHHYAISDDGRRPSMQEDLMDVLQEMEFSNEQRPQAMRRGSIEEVSKIRQWLNPRSSFSGASTNEASTENTGATKCWVTTIETQDDFLPILVLNYSFKKSCSRYKLIVLYTEQTEMVASRLRDYGVETRRASDIAPILFSPQNQMGTADSRLSRWTMLFPFVSLTNDFELVCYLSPRALVLSNIDELLDSDAVAAEIDNETCVLLSNHMGARPTIMVLRPNKEIDACIREYMTVYLNAQNNGKWAKLQAADGSSVLRELFEDSWGLVAADFCHSGPGHIQPNAKIVECTTTQPWNLSYNDEASVLWRRAWSELI
ncbi:Ids2p [Lachancea thermotolerans CBS 6340]|uniref:KLTH0F05412p n=1 Tax=Lachancea thermotolerans (strain ATCC 56472 / CBS 6340 / NRRL Y-8284) TaxID=559295 RepID=C5DKK2_LACTC|nr:KLTH0F05412p [Lachancea thermotolerans CBS 6340]CAR24003.1 KLTH0F05412p [Lachancea thermotolerans CBS 6340]